MKKTLIFSIVILSAFAVLLFDRASAYVLMGAKWGTSKYTYLVNPANISGLSELQFINSVQSAANAWNSQSGLTLSYGGTTANSGLTYDGKNIIFARSVPDGYLATTYSWWSGSTLLDADILVNETYYKLSSPDQACAGQDLVNTLTHEIGHASGLSHSDVPGATMYPYVSPCDTWMRTPEADDVAGLQAIYGNQSGPAPTPADTTSPTTSITSPVSGSTVSARGKVSISATATDNVKVTTVEFYADTTLLCRTSKSPYSCSWGSRVVGKTYSLTSKAYDAAGNSSFSSPVTVTVK